MNRYVDADKMLERTKAMKSVAEAITIDGIVKYIENNIEDDVRRVRHGKWIEDGYYDISCVCSVCGAEAQYTSRFEETFDYDWEENLQSTGHEEIKEYIRAPYCSNCGAKMDGKDGE